ncbi:MAG: fumarylacetoacetate hydrolase family protein [Devosia sp.]|uniref:fumarylacetoacetate hydrolase family protein n=1 Tax=Devosia sp. TaxID=1871048 RepID=UPI00262FA89B|nr:fumarylacetoacetate hydrolase family protein [Devosia sp.]MDB5538001.1 fumarylacetoacetate hydrolase family protein [Devosia sp.]MDB5588430.1 fumarylacetoacetate hydrolase family protein [Devosia sp.]
MADFLFEPYAPASVPIARGGLFAVRRIYCVGRNYAEHIREMGNDERDPPFFFAKPADALVIGGADTPYPSLTSDFHHEIELVVAIGKDGENIAEADALDHVYGYAAGIDMTRRDLQAVAKKAGRPWEMAKGFDHSAPIGSIEPASNIGHPDKGAITLSVNGQERQRGDLGDQIWSVAATIAELSRFVALKAGDLIMTGTPSGVSAVVRGDVLEGKIEGVGTVRTKII